MTVIIDLRSDAVTLPTEAMWQAMRSVTQQWRALDVLREVEYLAAQVSGRPAALFVHSGTAANTLALLASTAPGDQFISESRTHVLVSEDQAFARLAGTYPSTIAAPSGHPSPEQVESALSWALLGHRARTTLVWIENTHNFAGGTVANPAEVERICELAHRAGARVHMDGARIFNAAAALGGLVREIGRACDSVTINVNKGLSAPAGAFLCGDAEFVERARRRYVGLGGGISQTELLAAAAGVSLRTMLDQPALDNRAARDLADVLRGVPGIAVPDHIETNIVLAEVTGSYTANEAVEWLASAGVLALAVTDSTLRFVTNRHIDAAATVRVADTLRRRGRRPSQGLYS